MVGAKVLRNNIANIHPSGYAGFITRINIPINPIKIPYINLPLLVVAAVTGSVAINAIANKNDPIIMCCVHVTVINGVDPNAFSIHVVPISPTTIPAIILQLATRVKSKINAPNNINTLFVSPTDPGIAPQII